MLSVFPRKRVLTPDDVRRGAATLREGIAASGWPTLGESRSRVVFFIDNKTKLRDFYTHGGKGLEGRLMFIDADPRTPSRGILLADDPLADANRIADALAAGLIVRTRADQDDVDPLAGDTTKRDAALASGAQLVSTDYPAAVSGVPMTVIPTWWECRAARRHGATPSPHRRSARRPTSRTRASSDGCDDQQPLSAQRPMCGTSAPRTR